MEKYDFTTTDSSSQTQLVALVGLQVMNDLLERAFPDGVQAQYTTGDVDFKLVPYKEWK
jgi:hypothetical protein